MRKVGSKTGWEGNTANPIRVAMEELQLQDLQNIEAICSEVTRGQKMTMSKVEKHEPAVEVKQNARPARHEDPTVPSTPANGRESKRPIVLV